MEGDKKRYLVFESEFGQQKGVGKQSLSVTFSAAIGILLSSSMLIVPSGAAPLGESSQEEEETLAVSGTRHNVLAANQLTISKRVSRNEVSLRDLVGRVDSTESSVNQLTRDKDAMGKRLEHVESTAKSIDETLTVLDGSHRAIAKSHRDLDENHRSLYNSHSRISDMVSDNAKSVFSLKKNFRKHELALSDLNNLKEDHNALEGEVRNLEEDTEEAFDIIFSLQNSVLEQGLALSELEEEGGSIVKSVTNNSQQISKARDGIDLLTTRWDVSREEQERLKDEFRLVRITQEHMLASAEIYKKKYMPLIGRLKNQVETNTREVDQITLEFADQRRAISLVENKLDEHDDLLMKQGSQIKQLEEARISDRRAIEKNRSNIARNAARIKKGEVMIEKLDTKLSDIGREMRRSVAMTSAMTSIPYLPVNGDQNTIGFGFGGIGETFAFAIGISARIGESGILRGALSFPLDDPFSTLGTQVGYSLSF